MRFIKLGFISLIAFSVLITIFSFFFPSRVRISKAIDINAPRDSVLMQLKDITKWKSWYPGADTMQLISEGNQTVLKTLFSPASIVITEISDSTVKARTSGKNSVNGWNVFESGRPNTVTVQWYMDFRLKWYPWEKFSGLLLEKRYGPSMEKGLERLRVIFQK